MNRVRSLFTDINSFMETNPVNSNLPCKVNIRDEDPETSVKTAFRKIVINHHIHQVALFIWYRQ